jgi:hypothetical protein
MTAEEYNPNKLVFSVSDLKNRDNKTSIKE